MLAMFMMMIMIVVMVFMIMAMASLTVLVIMVFVVVVMVMMLMVVVFVVVVMVMIVTACTFVLVHVEINAGIFHRMHHRMFQFTLVHIHHGGHEVEVCLLGRFQIIVVLHTDLEIREIQGDPLAIHGDGHLDVSHQIAGLLLDPLADLHHHRIQSCLGIRIESVYVPGESYTDTSDHIS